MPLQELRCHVASASKRDRQRGPARADLGHGWDTNMLLYRASSEGQRRVKARHAFSLLLRASCSTPLFGPHNEPSGSHRPARDIFRVQLLQPRCAQHGLRRRFCCPGRRCHSGFRQPRRVDPIDASRNISRGAVVELHDALHPGWTGSGSAYRVVVEEPAELPAGQVAAIEVDQHLGARYRTLGTRSHPFSQFPHGLTATSWPFLTCC